MQLHFYHLSWTQSVTTHKRGTPKPSLPQATPKPSYSHKVQTNLRPRDPGKLSPDLSRVRSRDIPTPWVSRDLVACDPGNKPPDLPRDWSATRSPDQTRFKRAPSPLIGTWKTVETINGLLSNQQSHKTLVRSTKAHPPTVLVPALKYGPPV